jgi:hypothetical protein
LVKLGHEPLLIMFAHNGVSGRSSTTALEKLTLIVMEYLNAIDGLKGIVRALLL